MHFLKKIGINISNINYVEGCFQKKIYNKLENKMEEVDDRRIVSFFIEDEIHFIDIFLKKEEWKPASIYHYRDVQQCKNCLEFDGKVVCCQKYEQYIEEVFQTVIQDKRIRLKMVTLGIYGAV